MFVDVKSLLVVPAVLSGLLAVSTPVLADRPYDARARAYERQQVRQEVRHDARGYVLDNRYNHNHYYPPRGYVVAGVPRGATIVRRGGVPYYFHEGIWYRPSGPRFVVVAPPVGLFVSTLPPFYTTVWWRGVPYYYADDTYYVWRPERHGYVVSEPPSESEVTPQAAGGGDLFIYPKNGQSEEQQAKDRYECHSWGSQQTGFDPTQSSGGVPESQAAAKRADYQRAMTACLEARGYSVK